MDITRLTIEVRDKNLNRIGQIPPQDLSLTIEDQFNNVGSWTLTLASESPLATILRQPGSGIIVTLEDGTVLMSGPTIKPEDAATATDPNGTLTVNGLTDTVLLADRLCFPNPTNLNPANQSKTHDLRVGKCEDLMHAYVNANIGPGAPTSADPNLGSRRDPRLTMGANLHRGPLAIRRARFDVLGELLAELATTADIGFRVVQVGNKLQFQTFAVADRSKSIRLDIRNNMLAGHNVAIAPPTVTRAIVAGQDIEREENETDSQWKYERQFAAVTSAAALDGEARWGRRIEKFIDKRQSDGNDELVQAGQEALEKGGASQISVQVVPMEDFFSTFGVDWRLGDHITVVVQGKEMQSNITGYVLKYDKDGFRMGVTLGDPTAIGPDRKAIDLGARVSNLERTSVTPTALAAQSATVDAKLAEVDATLASALYDARLTPARYNQAALLASYPPGMSFLYLTNSDSVAGGWDFGNRYGLVTTYKGGDDFAVQTWVKHQGGTSGPTELWQRTANKASGWSRWQRATSGVITVKDQTFGTVPAGLSVATISLPSGKAMPDTNYGIQFMVTERTDGQFGSAGFTAVGARPLSTTSFLVQINSNWTTALTGFISYTLTPVQG